MTDIKQFNDTSQLSSLGSKTTDYDYGEPTPAILETFENTGARDYVVNLEVPEWSGLCPKTHQPDFAHISIAYVPDKKCIESKSLKLYVFAYRNYGCFMESTTNKFVDDIVAVCDPKWIRVRGVFKARGGIALNVVAEHFKDGCETMPIPMHPFGKEMQRVIE